VPSRSQGLDDVARVQREARQPGGQAQARRRGPDGDSYARMQVARMGEWAMCGKGVARSKEENELGLEGFFLVSRVGRI
jgi:hypothetical protein